MNPMEQVLTLPGEVERWAHYGTEYVKADDYAALNDYAALVQMERDMARAEVEAHKRSRQLDANEARSREQELRAEVELLKVDLDETIKDSHKQLAEVERLRDLLAPAAYWLRAFDCGDVLTMEGQEAVSNLIESIEIAARLSDPTDGSR